METFLTPDPHFSHQDCVCLDCYKHFTAAGPFQCLIMSIMNGETGLRLEFIVLNCHCRMNFESRMGTILAPDPHFSHQ
eukprot:scaffold3684_cov64-Cyclotella_meneghiniana.AAC.2